MATFTKELNPPVREFDLVLISNFSSFSYKQKRHFLKTFDYGGMHLKTDHFKLRASLETLFKLHMKLESVVLLEYLMCLNDCGYGNVSSIVPLQVQIKLFW